MIKEFLTRVEHRSPGFTPITPEAYRYLHSWGVRHKQIEQIRHVANEFDGAYLNCLQKVKALRTIQALSRYSIIIPHFNEGNVLPHGGSCREITDALIERIYSSGLLKEINKNKQDQVELRICRGGNTSHFKHGGHVWVSLVRKSKPDDSVVIDGSYQQISCLKSNGYRLNHSDNPADVKKETQTELPISHIQINKDGIEVSTSKDRVLGLSTDRSVSFSIGYTAWSLYPQSEHFDKLVAFIRVGHANSTDAAIFLVNPYTGKINVDYCGEAFALSNSSSQELSKILAVASQIQFIE